MNPTILEREIVPRESLGHRVLQYPALNITLSFARRQGCHVFERGVHGVVAWLFNFTKGSRFKINELPLVWQKLKPFPPREGPLSLFGHTSFARWFLFMNKRVKNIGGHRFGKLTVIYRAGKGYHGITLWRCWCECGKMKTIAQHSLVHGYTRSCGCTSITHGLTRGGKPPEYKVWIHVKNRCLNPECPAYEDYGGRGITVCDQWKNDFAQFLKDMGPRPPKTSIERIDNDKGYEPDNCKWGTQKEQANNRRSSRLIHFNGQSRTLMQWSEHLGIGVSTLWRRLHVGWSVEKAFTSKLTTRP